MNNQSDAANKQLVQSIDSIFSLLPEVEAFEARQSVLEGYLENKVRFSGTIRWADFDFSGHFIRGGVSDLKDLSTRIVQKPADDFEIARLISKAKQLNLKPGLVEAQPGEEKLIWFIPYTPTDPSKQKKTQIRALSITLDLFGQVIDLFNERARLTPAEKRIGFQILSGSSLKTAALADNVTLETKRAQLKSACAKLECKGQTELVRLVLGQLVHFVYVSENETTYTQIAENFMMQHLGDNVTLSVQRLSNGRLLRYLECGPSEGRPILMVHGFLFPFALINAKPYLQKHKLRLITPLRTGYLDKQSSLDLYRDEDALSQSVEDLSLFLNHMFNEPIVVLGELSGGFGAIMLADRKPAAISSLILLSINLAKGDTSSTTFAEKFFGGLQQLSSKPGVFRFVTWQFRKFNTTKFAMRATMKRMFKECQSDIDALDGKVGAGSAYDWFVESFRHSMLGIADDFRMILSGDWHERFAKLNMPIHLIHGPYSPITKQSDVKKLTARNVEAKLHILADGGHFATASHPDLVWQKISDCLS